MSQRMESNFASFVVENAKRTPEKLCFAIGEDRLSYRDLLYRIAYLKREFESLGVVKDDNVLITIAPSADFFAAILAVFSIGAVIVVIDPAMGVARLNHCINMAKPKAWITHKGKYWYLKWMMSSVRHIPIKIEISADRTPVDASSLPDVDVARATRCLATFTTGSTGMPKILYRDHGYLQLQTRAVSQSYAKVKGLSFREDAKYVEEKDEVGFTNLTMVPLHFMKIGATCFVLNNIKSFDPEVVVNTMAEIGVTYGAASPNVAHRLCTYCLSKNRPLPIKILVVGGAPVYRHMVDDMRKATSLGQLVIVYGSTEAEPIAFIDAGVKIDAETETPGVGHCVGMPFLEGNLKVVTAEEKDQTGTVEDLEVPSGENGEIVVSGWHVNIEAAAKSRILLDRKGEKWLKTGDAGHVDAAGRVWLVGRTSWKVDKDGTTFWSVLVEEKIFDRFKDSITFVSYFFRGEKTYLIVEKSRDTGIEKKDEIAAFLEEEAIPCDEFRMYDYVPRDRRHNSKPDMAALFSDDRGMLARFLMAFAAIIFAVWLLYTFGIGGGFIFLFLAAVVALVFMWHQGLLF